MWNWFHRGESIRPANRCVVICQRPLVRIGARIALTAPPEFGVVGEADNVPRAASWLSEPGLCVVVFDLDVDRSTDSRSGGSSCDDSAWISDGVATVDRLSRRLSDGSSIVAVIARNDPLAAGQLLAAGARGCVTDSASVDELRAAVRAASGGRLYLSPALVARFTDTSHVSALARSLATLTERECQVFRQTGLALSTNEIADRMRISTSTVDAYRRRLCQKLTLRNDDELAYYARVWIQLHPMSFDDPSER